MNDIKDKLKGALYAAALGDAMGATTELMNEDEIKEKYGVVDDLIGGGWLCLKAGKVTDDTKMSLCIMRVLMKIGIEKLKNIDLNVFKKDVTDEFLNWFDTNPKDIGKQCKSALSFYKRTNKYIEVDDSALGNGSLMRALPCALLNIENSYALNVAQGEITHNNKVCSDILIKYTDIIKNNIFSKDIKLEKRKLLKPSGYIVNTFNNAIYFASKKTFRECILSSVNHGGDADTISSIASSICASRVGFSVIDKKWIDKLDVDVKKVLDKFLEFVLKTY